MRIEAISQQNSGDQGDLSIPWLMLHCLGFGSCSAWVHVSFFSTMLFSGDGDVGLLAWLVDILANGLAMVALGLAGGRVPSLNTKRGFAWGAAVAVGLATLVSAFLRPWLPMPAYLLLGPGVAGVGTAALLLLWAEGYTQIDGYTAKKFTLPGAMATGVIEYLLVAQLPQGLGVIVTALLPTLSVVCLRSTCCLDGADFRDKAESRQAAPKEARRLLRFTLAIAVYSLASGFMSGRSTSFTDAQANGAGTAMFAGIAVLLIVVAVASIALVRQDGNDLVYRMIVPLMAAGLLIMPFLSDTVASAASNIAIMGGYVILEIYVWSQLQSMVHDTSRAPATVFGIGKSGMNLGLLVGCLLGVFAAGRSTMVALAIATVIVYIFILLGVRDPMSGFRDVATTERPISAEPVLAAAATEGASEAAAPVVADSRQTAYRLLARRYSLSSREEEVLEMLCCGRSLEATAKGLGIAQSTVRTHRDHIYQKLGIHDRQELLDMVDGARDD